MIPQCCVYTCVRAPYDVVHSLVFLCMSDYSLHSVFSGVYVVLTDDFGSCYGFARLSPSRFSLLRRKLYFFGRCGPFVSLVSFSRLFGTRLVFFPMKLCECVYCRCYTVRSVRLRPQGLDVRSRRMLFRLRWRFVHRLYRRWCCQEVRGVAGPSDIVFGKPFSSMVSICC